MSEEEVKNRLECLEEIIKFEKDETVTYRDISDDVIVSILKKYNLY